MDEDTLAPPIKQKARFKIKDAKCHLRPRNKEKHRDSSKQNLQGKLSVTSAQCESIIKHITSAIFCLVALYSFLLLYLFLHLKGGQFPCTDDCQVTFVNLKCDSSKKRRRGRKSPTKEVSHITAEFEMEMKEEEASGVMFSSAAGRSL